MPPTPMTKEDAARIQRAQAKEGGDADFVRRAQSAGDKNANDAKKQSGQTPPKK
ncbi:uncharacterized protein CPUR_04247 [Claviceps purpurea 20.1]|uniref:SMP domain-containing protein n=1 Tax=Claviceps purpurea (strain 20.1) TaxID=1111077 RepID=M1WEV1_CLAP2|nr:hypothetical protein E4U45_000161 [Claviceps purpurea]CCE30399.1 uncharacterized protein CPUR_04247 [Claviceps purpurea 20.1]